jgi:hypothetical protein
MGAILAQEMVVVLSIETIGIKMTDASYDIKVSLKVQTVCKQAILYIVEEERNATSAFNMLKPIGIV